MTQPDSLERIVEEMRAACWETFVDDREYRNRNMEPAEISVFAARIEALIPSKAEAEFMRAAEEYFRQAHLMPPAEVGYIRNFVQLEEWYKISIEAYRALLAEREGKRG